MTFFNTDNFRSIYEIALDIRGSAHKHINKNSETKYILSINLQNHI